MFWTLSMLFVCLFHFLSSSCDHYEQQQQTTKTKTTTIDVRIITTIVIYIYVHIHVCCFRLFVVHTVFCLAFTLSRIPQQLPKSLCSKHYGILVATLTEQQTHRHTSDRILCAIAVKWFSVFRSVNRMLVENSLHHSNWFCFTVQTSSMPNSFK